MHATPSLAAVREWWTRVRVGGRRLCAVLPTPLDAVVWQVASSLGFTLVVAGGIYLFLWGGLAATSRTAVYVVMFAAPLAVAGRVGWRAGTIVNTHPDFSASARPKESNSPSGPTPASEEEEEEEEEEWERHQQGRRSVDSSLPAGWAWWRLLPPGLQSFVGIIGIGALVSGVGITVGWVVALRVFHLTSLPLWVVALYFLPLVVVVSYGGSLAQTAATLVSVLWRTSMQQLETPRARRSHTVRGLAVLAGFVIVGLGPAEFLSVPVGVLLAVTWTGLFLYLFFLFTQLQFLGMARSLTPDERAAVVPPAIEKDPYTTMFVATAGVRTTAMATGIWPIRRIYVGEALLEDDALARDALQAVVAHERAHHDLGHLWVSLGAGLGFVWGAGAVFTVFGFGFSSQVSGLVVAGAALLLRYVVVRWVRQAELAADASASRVTTPRTVIAALERVDAIQSESAEPEHAGTSDHDEAGDRSRTEMETGTGMETSGAVSGGRSGSPTRRGSNEESMVEPGIAVSPWVDEVLTELFLRMHPPLEDRIAALESRSKTHG